MVDHAQPGYRHAVWALFLAVLGPFVMAASSPAAIVLGWRALRASAAAGPRTRGRATAAGAITIGTFGWLLWAWALWWVWMQLPTRGIEREAVLPLAAGLAVVWAASAAAGALAGRGRDAP